MAFLKYYAKMLGASSVATGHVSNSVMAAGPRVQEESYDMLCAPFSSEEVKQAMFSIDENRAAGLDGYSSCFFKKAWVCVGDKVSEVVLEFFSKW